MGRLTPLLSAAIALWTVLCQAANGLQAIDRRGFHRGTGQYESFNSEVFVERRRRLADSMGMATAAPTAAISLSPSEVASSSPSTAAPSIFPSPLPSRTASEVPTTMPSNAPSSTPSTVPSTSSFPSLTSSPTTEPSAVPSSPPPTKSPRPSISVQPTQIATIPPTPTDVPASPSTLIPPMDPELFKTELVDFTIVGVSSDPNGKMDDIYSAVEGYLLNSMKNEVDSLSTITLRENRHSRRYERRMQEESNWELSVQDGFAFTTAKQDPSEIHSSQRRALEDTIALQEAINMSTSSSDGVEIQSVTFGDNDNGGGSGGNAGLAAGLSIAAVVLTVAGVFFYRRHRRKKARRLEPSVIDPKNEQTSGEKQENDRDDIEADANAIETRSHGNGAIADGPSVYNSDCLISRASSMDDYSLVSYEASSQAPHTQQKQDPVLILRPERTKANESIFNYDMVGEQDVDDDEDIDPSQFFVTVPSGQQPGPKRVGRSDVSDAPSDEFTNEEFTDDDNTVDDDPNEVAISTNGDGRNRATIQVDTTYQSSSIAEPSANVEVIRPKTPKPSPSRRRIGRYANENDSKPAQGGGEQDLSKPAEGGGEQDLSSFLRERRNARRKNASVEE